MNNDYISRQAVLDLIEHYNSDGLGSVFYGYDEGVKFAKTVSSLPSVNPTTDTLGKIRNELLSMECMEEAVEVVDKYRLEIPFDGRNEE